MLHYLQGFVYNQLVFEICITINSFVSVCQQELMSAAKERQTPVCFRFHQLSNHTFANCLIWKTSVNCVSDLSRRDKCLLK